MIYIYTENFFFSGKLKKTIKRLLGREYRGPQAVVSSLVSGLTESGAEFVVDKNFTGVANKVLVLNGYKVLQWAIKQKQLGRIKNLIAGPNVVVAPVDHNNLIMAQEIDRYLVPAEWPKEWWRSFNAKWVEKVVVWPAGVADLGKKVDVLGKMLVFYKSGPLSLAEQAFELGTELKLNPQLFLYGKFKQQDYLKILEQTKFIVYIGESESQGLALHEAWMAGVPTLVWGGGEMKVGSYRFKAEKISAPYLTPECGNFFANASDLKNQLEIFLKNYDSFNPREYSLKNFTNKVTAKNLLDIINSI